jgi:signal transduction histidine kinase
MTLWPRSLQAQLVLRLAAVFLVAAGAGVGALFYESGQTADALRREELFLRARQLARLIEPAPDRAWQISSSTETKDAYRSAGTGELFLIRSADGKALAASTSDAASTLAAFPLGTREPRYIRSRSIGQQGQEYCALTVRADSEAGPVSITVARPLAGDALAHTVLKEFVSDIAWAILLFAAVMLAVAVWSIRRSLKPVVAASGHAASIGPEATNVRLSTEQLPTELVPLVTAINQGLERLERGLLLQREFTANAAHQLRTPLTILTAQLDELDDDARAQRLKGDAARMNRLIDQLLRVARLDAVPLSISPAVDLKEIAAESVRFLAPWAIKRRRAIGFEAPEDSVWVRGNADALGDALRNLIENAVSHTLPDTEITVSVMADGSVAVTDRGAGVPPEHRERIFERFWRGRAADSTGAGLGLAIVDAIAKAHGGQIEVADGRGGGATFTLRLRTAASPLAITSESQA